MLLTASTSHALLDRTLGLALLPGVAETIVTWTLGALWVLWLGSAIVAVLDRISD